MVCSVSVVPPAREKAGACAVSFDRAFGVADFFAQFGDAVVEPVLRVGAWPAYFVSSWLSR